MKTEISDMCMGDDNYTDIENRTICLETFFNIHLTNKKKREKRRGQIKTTF